MAGGGEVEGRGERTLKGWGGGEEIRRKEEELSRVVVQQEEGRGVEEWQRRVVEEQERGEVVDMEAMRRGRAKAQDDVEFIDVMRSKPKVSYSSSSTLERLLKVTNGQTVEMIEEMK